MTSTSKEELKKAFLAGADKILSGEFLASKLKVTRTAVWKSIRMLNKEGWKITAVRNKGYKLSEPPDLIDEHRLKKWVAMNNDFVSGLKYDNAMSSTQEAAKKVSDNSSVESLLVVAEEQTASYGRMRRKWVSKRGGLWVSIMVKPPIPPQKAALLTLLFSLSCSEVLEEYLKSPVSVKWPNDVYYRGKKICGVLTELSADPDSTRWVVVGAGINVNNRITSDIKYIADSILRITGRKSDRTVLLIEILDNFKAKYFGFLKKGFEGFKSKYIKRLIWVGEKAVVKTALNQNYSGIITGIDENGFLILSGKSGRMAIPSGDVVKHRKAR